MLTYSEKEIIRVAIQYLSHPELRDIPFCIPASNVARSLEIMLEQQEND